MCGKTVASDTHLLLLHKNFHICCSFFFIPVRFSHHYKWINPCWALNTKKDGDIFILFFKSVRLIAAIRTSWKVFLIRWIFHFLKWKLVFIFHMLSCWSAQMKNGTQDLQKGWFYAPTQVVLLFVKDALCWECWPLSFMLPFSIPDFC